MFAHFLVHSPPGMVNRLRTLKRRIGAAYAYSKPQVLMLVKWGYRTGTRGYQYQRMINKSEKTNVKAKKMADSPTLLEGEMVGRKTEVKDWEIPPHPNKSLTAFFVLIQLSRPRCGQEKMKGC